MRQIILASISPRRKQLMELLQLKFKVVESNYEEVMHKHMSHPDLVQFLALGKAQAAAKQYPKAVIITADTIVSFQGKAIGKPKTEKEAYAMLKSFSGKVQSLVTGVVVLDAETGKLVKQVITTKIYFKKLSAQTIKAYVESGEPYDKAGGYNLQGRGFSLIKKVEGDFTNNLGLPLGVVYNALQKLEVIV